MFSSRSDTKPECDGQTDGQSHRIVITISYTASINEYGRTIILAKAQSTLLVSK